MKATLPKLRLWGATELDSSCSTTVQQGYPLKLSSGKAVVVNQVMYLLILANKEFSWKGSCKVSTDTRGFPWLSTVAQNAFQILLGERKRPLGMDTFAAGAGK